MTQTTQDRIYEINHMLSKYFPFTNVSKWALHKESEQFRAYILVSFDSKNTWTNWYVENSKYARFSVEDGGNIKLFAGSWVQKLRACKFKDLENLEKKISEWFTLNNK